MTPLGEPAVGRFCWLDLAASDATEAKAFYRQWRHLHAPVLARSRCRSLYQMETKLARKVSSHCTPYVRVEDVQLAAQRASLADACLSVLSSLPAWRGLRS
jgi:hypothetical protein